MVKFFKFLAVAAALVLIAWSLRNFVIERRTLDVDRVDVTESADVPDRDPGVAWDEINGRWPDSIPRQIVVYEKDPTTGSRFFAVDGKPVQGKLKGCLEAATDGENGGGLPIFIDHPDGESNKWVEIPMPLFLSLTLSVTERSPFP